MSGNTSAAALIDVNVTLDIAKSLSVLLCHVSVRSHVMLVLQSKQTRAAKCFAYLR